MGLTATKEFTFKGDWDLNLIAEADKFIGGKADIRGIGEVDIGSNELSSRALVVLKKSF